MADSFFEQIKPAESGWMGALIGQRNLRLENAKLGAELMRTGTPQEQAIGQELVRRAGIDTVSPAAPSQFDVMSSGVQMPTMAAPQQGRVPQFGEQGYNEAQYYQNQGASNVDSFLKGEGRKMGYWTDQTTGKLYKGKQEVTDVGQLTADMDKIAGRGQNAADFATQNLSYPDDSGLAAAQMTAARIKAGETLGPSYQQSIANDLGLNRYLPEDQARLAQTIANRDTQAAQQKAVANTPLMQRIRAHSFSQTSSPAEAYGIGMDTIDKLERQGALNPQMAQDLRDNYTMSFNDETFTGTKGAGTGHYYQEKLKRQRGGGPGANDYEPLQYQNAQGQFIQGSFRMPKLYKGDWRRYSNEKTSQFANDVKLSFGLDDAWAKDFNDFVQGKGNYKTKGIPSNYPGLPDELKTAGGSSLQAMPSTYTPAAAAAYEAALKKNPNDQASAKAAGDRAMAQEKGTPKLGFGW